MAKDDGFEKIVSGFGNTVEVEAFPQLSDKVIEIITDPDLNQAFTRAALPDGRRLAREYGKFIHRLTSPPWQISQHEAAAVFNLLKAVRDLRDVK